MFSLRNKILTFYGLSTIALLVSLAVVINLLSTQQLHIEEGETISDLIVAYEKIRQEENNLFSYQDPNAIKKLRLYLKAEQSALEKGKQKITAIADPEELKQMQQILQNYSELLDQYAKLPAESQVTVRIEIKNARYKFSKLIQLLNQRQRDLLANAAKTVSSTLVISSITLILLGLFGATFLVRRVCRPLRKLENQLDQLAEGEVKELNLPYSEKEIHSFMTHFNTMLEQMRDQQTQLRRHERAAALGVLVSGVAHELNNPLSNISTSVQLLMEDDGTTREDLRMQWLSQIDGESVRARNIVKRLLDTVRQPTPNRQALEAAELVLAATKLVLRQLPIEMLLHIENIDEGIVEVDQDRMKQVFINLMKNASNAGCSNIWITGRVTTWKESRPVDSNNLAGDTTGICQSHKVMLINVEDDGPGIASEDLPRLFDPFFTTQAAGEGTGLGLYLVKEIINEHQGCLAVENRPNGGARFSIWLPLKQNA
jgi:signal transduction histidine kinase